MDRIRIAPARMVLTLLSLSMLAPPGSMAASAADDVPGTIAAIEVRLSDDAASGSPSDAEQSPISEAGPGGCAAPLESCCVASRWWAGVDYACWWLQGNPLPALVTSSPDGTPRAQAGVLGQPGTRVLLGDQRVDGGARQGARLAGGYWFDDCQTTGLELTFFGLGGDDTHYAATSLGAPILARPFFDTQLGQQALLVAFPGVVQGNVDVLTNSELYSFAATLRRTWKSGCLGRVDVIGGYRYLRFREGLRITDHLLSTDPAGRVPVGTTFDLVDDFAAETNFNGGEVGLRSEFCRGAFTLSAMTKLGIGAVHEVVNIGGSDRILTPFGQSRLLPGGLLTQTSNIGNFTRDEFGLLPELGLSLAYQLTPNLSVSAGYSLLYLTRALRTGDQIDSAVDTSQIGGNPVVGAHPIPLLHSTSLSAQGLNLGAEYRF